VGHSHLHLSSNEGRPPSRSPRQDIIAMENGDDLMGTDDVKGSSQVAIATWQILMNVSFLNP